MSVLNEIRPDEIERIVNIKRKPGGHEIHWEEDDLREILTRASKLSLDDLKRLLVFVGVTFKDPEILDKVACLEVLDEADSLEKAREFLDLHGV
jgi:hypothetical protein